MAQLFEYSDETLDVVLNTSEGILQRMPYSSLSKDTEKYILKEGLDDWIQPLLWFWVLSAFIMRSICVRQSVWVLASPASKYTHETSLLETKANHLRTNHNYTATRNPPDRRWQGSERACGNDQELLKWSL